MGLVLAEKILPNMEKRKLNGPVFLDQSKAFDTVNQPVMKLNDLTHAASLQIILFYKPVVCQARAKVLPDIQSVWSDKNIFPHLKIERMTCFS